MIAVTASRAEAGAWTRERGEGLLILGVSIHELLPAKGYEALDRLKGEVSAYAEYGFNDRLTLVGRAAWQSMHATELMSEEIRYTVQLEPPPDPLRDDPDEDFDGDGVPNRLDPPPAPDPIFVERTRTEFFLPEPETGVGGLEAGIRYRFIERSRFVLSAQALAGIPGTGENRNNHRFGEGGGAVDLRLQAGRSFGRSAFANISVGSRFLPGDRPDELRLDLTAGTHIARGVRVMAQSYSVWSTGEGVSGLHGYSGHRAQLSLLWPIDSARRAQIAALTTFHRDNMSRETALIASVWRTF